MQQPITFYQTQASQSKQAIANFQKQLNLSSLLRLIAFLAIPFAIYFFFGNIKLVLLTALSALVVFLLLVSRHENLLYKKAKAIKLLNINQRELLALQGDVTALKTGNQFVNPQHYYSHDIDLFGKGSFFQFLNRTATQAGMHTLAKQLLSNHIQDIPKKQEAIKALTQIPKWRQQYEAIASLSAVETSANSIVDWISNHKAFTSKRIAIFANIFSVASLVVFALLFFGKITFFQLLIWLTIGLLITGRHLTKINDLYKDANKAKATFRQYYKLLEQIETQKFTAAFLIEKQQNIKTETQKASQIFKQFSKYLDALDQRNNMLFGLLGNGFLLWDIQQSYKIEKWMSNYATKVKNWFDVIAYFDAQNSLANMAFNQVDFNYPEITNTKNILEATNLGHPLLHSAKRVANDFSIEKEQFFIITGANMAGKSTFLRTISLSIVMANMGLPICASACLYSPTKLITSMRTTDSLSNDESYFFSELKRLKFIVDQIKSEDYFIILDEILKGTNSTDKAIGSKKFVQKLVGSHSTGIIATHDLSLCEISKDLNEVKNYYFDAQIKNDELLFDYTLKKGICQNMNASFLLKKMQIV